jgi:hypothetical protein
MAFLDNSGDIILDAVLTDTGRMRLAKGDGSFKIAKFALGDDEINYELYDKNHASGSAYYDIEIVQSPVLEAFTNNTSMMKSKLMTISRTNLLYLPQIVNNTVKGLASYSANNILTVFVDQTTAETGSLASDAEDYINGYIMESTSKPIVMDQGIKSNALGNGKDVVLDADLRETQYTIEIDNRFGKLWSGDGTIAAKPSFVDDDNVAVYYLSSRNAPFFSTLDSSQAISGPRGTRLKFLVGPSTNLNSSTYLFTQLGTTSTLNSTAVYQIDTTVRITGVTTGYRVDLPIRFVKAI